MAGKIGAKMKKPLEDSPRFPEYYKKLNPNWSNEQCNEAAKHFKKSCNSGNIEYYERFYPELLHEEHLEMLENKRKMKRQNSPLQFIYWKNKYPELSEQEQKEKFEYYKKSKCKFNIIYWEEKYPELSKEEQEKMHIEWVENYKANQPKMIGERNGMHRSKRTEQQLAENCPWKIEFYQKHYPELSLEEQEKLRQDMINKTQKNIVSNCSLEYYLNKGMTEQEAKKALSERQATCKLDKFIEKYGEIDGIERWKKRNKKWQISLLKNFEKYGDNRSPQSKWATEIMFELYKSVGKIIPKKEKFIMDKDTRNRFAYDFCYKNYIIEFNGDYWHTNPNIYDCSYLNKTKQKTAQEIWEYDKEKQNTAEKYGYKYLVVWESEYKEDPQGTIKKCLDFIKS